MRNAVQPVHRVVPHQPILLHVPVPDAESRRIDGELQPVFARAQPAFALLELALTALSRLDFADQIVERRLEPGRHVVERLREGAQLLQPAARHPRAQVAARHGLRRARDAPERRGHHRCQRRGQHRVRAPAPARTPSPNGCCRRARTGQIVRFGHRRHENPVTARAVVAIRRRVGQPRFPRERLRRDVIEPELRRCVGHARRTVCRARPPTALSTTGSPSGADEAIIAPVSSRMKARPSEPMAWLRSRDDERVVALRRQSATANVPGSRPAACGCSPTLPDEAASPASPHHRPRFEAPRSPWRPPSRARSAMNGVKMKMRIGRPSCTGRVRAASAAARFPDPFAAADRALSDVSGNFRPEPSKPSGQRQATRKAAGRQDPGDAQREEQRRRDVPVGDGGGELAEQMKPHITGSNSMISTTNTP